MITQGDQALEELVSAAESRIPIAEARNGSQGADLLLHIQEADLPLHINGRIFTINEYLNHYIAVAGTGTPVLPIRPIQVEFPTKVVELNDRLQPKSNNQAPTGTAISHDFISLRPTTIWKKLLLLKTKFHRILLQ